MGQASRLLSWANVGAIHEPIWPIMTGIASAAKIVEQKIKQIDLCIQLSL